MTLARRIVGGPRYESWSFQMEVPVPTQNRLALFDAPLLMVAVDCSSRAFRAKAVGDLELQAQRVTVRFISRLIWMLCSVRYPAIDRRGVPRRCQTRTAHQWLRFRVGR